MNDYLEVVSVVAAVLAVSGILFALQERRMPRRTRNKEAASVYPLPLPPIHGPEVVGRKHEMA